MITVKSITNIFRAPIKMRFTKERKKIKDGQSEKRNWKKMSSALPELMVIYVSHQFPFPPSQGSPFVIVITKGMSLLVNWWSWQSLHTALVILYTYAFTCTHNRQLDLVSWESFLILLYHIHIQNLEKHILLLGIPNMVQGYH